MLFDLLKATVCLKQSTAGHVMKEEGNRVRQLTKVSKNQQAVALFHARCERVMSFRYFVDSGCSLGPRHTKLTLKN